MESPRVLVVEDDSHLADLITMHLADAGYAVELAADGTQGLERALSGGYDVILLDLMLPGTDGLSICRRVRALDAYVPVLMVTARSEEIDKVLGLEMGADDYITKPFSFRELTARVKALLRRARAAATNAGDEGTGSFRIGEISIDREKHRVFRGDSEIELTAKEFDLITVLASHAGQAFNREQLLDKVWHYHHDGYNHTVNSHINRLRAKIEADPSHPRYVKTVWGYGYRFAEPEEFEDES